MVAAQRKDGFTLIELLTVIAIIAILAATTAVVAPRMIEKAKLRRLVGAMRNIEQAMTAYYGDQGTYPPNYGYLSWEAKDKAPGDIVPEDYELRPYMASLRLHETTDVYDEFSYDFQYDGDRDGHLSLLEFQPVGVKDQVTQTYTFPAGELYDDRISYGSQNQGIANEMDRIMAREEAPFAYIPVNLQNFKRARKYWMANNDYNAETWDASDQNLSRVQFPPPRYDAYVLVSVGPSRNTGGVLPAALPVGLATELEYARYHIQGLRAFFLATRDLDDNGELDFHFEARTQRGEANSDANVLPSGVNDEGPFIYVVQ